MIALLARTVGATEPMLPACTAGLVEQVLPIEGEVAPPEVRPLVVHHESCSGRLPVRLVAVDVLDPTVVEDVIPSTVQVISPTVSRIVPGGLLAVDGGYAVDVDGALTPFVIGDASPTAPAPPQTDVEFGHSCGDVTLLDATVRASFPAADDARGALLLAATVDGVSQGVASAVAYSGQADAELSGAVIGGRELCVTLRYEDLAGEVAWTTEEACGPAVDCPVDREVVDEEGCGCSSTSRSPILALLAWLLVRRRRDVHHGGHRGSRRGPLWTSVSPVVRTGCRRQRFSGTGF